MAFATLHPHGALRDEGRGTRTYYRSEGRPDRPVIVLCHVLGLDHTMWDPQVPDLVERYRVLRYDLRGHGASDAPSGDYSIADLGRDALALMDTVGVERAIWCGQSIGGMVGQWIALHAAERLSHLILVNTTPRVADPPGMEARRKAVLEHGVASVVDVAMKRFFTPALLEQNPPRVASARETFLATTDVGYAGCCAAVRDLDHRAQLKDIRTPTLVIGGDKDESMTFDGHTAVLARDIPRATLVRLAAAHVSSLELPRTFTRTVLEWLTPRAPERYEPGLNVRREVLGADHVDRALGTATDLTREFQQLITRYAWGEVWSRPGLDHRTRRLLVLAITAALGRQEEFHLHLRAGLDHGLEWSDIEEVLLQTAVYAGVPAANTAFKIAAEERARRS
jgi:3-oxoadipate enol-lactonase/4-carboxymuconolactone decarboxylase